ncbi:MULTISPECIES: hypothetical protein [unclassified Streptomyces]|uniref:hypothetical protein n=1 Tax=unclassified Streptomyces TaxID=2593676 RepID=UPI003646D726
MHILRKTRKFPHREDSVNQAQHVAVKSELERLAENCLYSAQSYFEAAKRAEFWGRFMVFIPACFAAVSGFMSTMSKDELWGAVSAVTGAIAATASFLGATKKAADFLLSARSYTSLRHRLRLEIGLLSEEADFDVTQRMLRELSAAYMHIVENDVPVPNRSFAVARERIRQGLSS